MAHTDRSASLDLAAQIREAEQAVIERDNRVRVQLQDLRAGVKERATSGVGRLALGAVGATVLALVAKRFWPSRKALPHAAFAHNERVLARAARKSRTSWTKLIGLVWPLLPIGVRSHVHPGLSGKLLGAIGMGHALAPRLAQRFGQKPPKTVPALALQRFAGRWYEIARLAETHEPTCASDATATYTVQPEGLTVENRCRRADGRLVGTRGAVEPVDASGAKLRVSFAPAWLRWLPMAWTDLWILDIDADYQCALLGTPDRQSLWMLARSPDLAGAEVRRLADLARSLGYDLSGLTATPHAHA